MGVRPHALAAGACLALLCVASCTAVVGVDKYKKCETCSTDSGAETRDVAAPDADAAPACLRMVLKTAFGLTCDECRERNCRAEVDACRCDPVCAKALECGYSSCGGAPGCPLCSNLEKDDVAVAMARCFGQCNPTCKQ